MSLRPAKVIRPTLSRVLAWRMGLVAVAVTLVLMGLFFAKYMLDVPALRRATLAAEAKAVVAAIQNDEDPAKWPHYQRWPQAYGLRVFDRRAIDKRHVLTEANVQLLSPLDDKVAPGAAASELEAGFSLTPGPDLSFGTSDDLWFLTERDHVGRKSYWVELVMAGDPGWRWKNVILAEMIDHVAVPALVMLPAMGVAMFLAARSALSPLTNIARQAGELGQALATGRTLVPLPEENLQQEIHDVVAALNTMLARLERTLRLQKQFTLDVAHELRTPLAVLLLQVSRLPPGQEVEQIRAEVAGLIALVQQLLRFAQTEDVMAGDRHPVDVVAAARRVCEELTPAAMRRGQCMEFEAPNEAVIYGHAALIDAAIRNMVENALKYAPNKATITVSVGNDGQVQVDDTGPGVADADKERIFDRFWRAERRGGGGAGIGLALVRRIAQLHDGDVRVLDRPGGGARFILRLSGGLVNLRRGTAWLP